ncbi:Mitochondrial chaperone BCS1 [Cyphellophora attinorum]|uniref:Mitochondrial chaperone BCS1 n=1 Tax=Cyphellophora attinorum TaxID=1664694 RepID=A0A0N1H9M1_9EURO|nr:Mitochondrial chaperone BCS1 [Phialophora attinorum]KPI44284.1 Mitochondrial chaperone BCS1 [Phialophora attinorum]
MQIGGSDASTAAVQPNAASKQELVQQLATSSNTDGGIIAQLTSNPFFTAGFGLAGLGAAATFARRGVKSGAALLKRRLLVDVEITNRDVSYQWFLYWLKLHEQGRLVQHAVSAGRKPSSMSALLQRLTPSMRQLSIDTELEKLPNGAIKANFVLVAGPGRHFLRYHNAFIAVNRQRETKQYTADGKPWETITLTTLYSQRHVFESIFTEAHALAVENVEGKTPIFIPRSTEWKEFGNARPKRPLESVLLDEGVKERIVSDVQDFIASKKWYADRGVPYRRGYLLYGPPGTGKSSFIQALAGHLDYNIALLNLSEKGMTDDRLNYLLTIIPERTIVLLEDVDVAWVNRRDMGGDGYNGPSVTMSGLLNALDGVASAEERIIFLTTNHVEKLDAALVRPGRVDMTVYLGNASVYQIQQLWKRFYDDVDPDGVHRQKFLETLQAQGMLRVDESGASASDVSPAAIQGLFLYNKDNPLGAIEMAGQLLPPLQGSPSSISAADKS